MSRLKKGSGSRNNNPYGDSAVLETFINKITIQKPEEEPDGSSAGSYRGTHQKPVEEENPESASLEKDSDFDTFLKELIVSISHPEPAETADPADDPEPDPEEYLISGPEPDEEIIPEPEETADPVPEEADKRQRYTGPRWDSGSLYIPPFQEERCCMCNDPLNRCYSVLFRAESGAEARIDLKCSLNLHTLLESSDPEEVKEAAREVFPCLQTVDKSVSGQLMKYLRIGSDRYHRM